MFPKLQLMLYYYDISWLLIYDICTCDVICNGTYFNGENEEINWYILFMQCMGLLDESLYIYNLCFFCSPWWFVTVGTSLSVMKYFASFCRDFRKCSFGADKCYFVHPTCKFNASCTRSDCPYTHTTRRPQQPTVPIIVQPIRGQYHYRRNVTQLHETSRMSAEFVFC